MAVDTNVLVYAFGNGIGHKTMVATDLLANHPVVSSQNLSEFINVFQRRYRLGKHQVGVMVSQVLTLCTYGLISPDDYLRADRLVERYDFQLFDAIILASALAAGCTTLHTEDMQHGQLVDDQLRIVNPFPA